MGEVNIPVEGTGLTLKGDDRPLLELTAQLMSPNEKNEGLYGPEAEQIAKNLLDKDKRINQDLIKIVQQKKSFDHCSQAAEWLLEGSNLLVAFLWRQDKKGGPARDYTV